MDPTRLMSTLVTITSSERVEWDTDALGRPARVDYRSTETVCRLVRQAAPEFDAERDGYVPSTYRCYLPAGTGVTDSDVLTIAGESYRPIAAAEEPRSPVTSTAYDVVLVRRVQEAT